LEKYQGFFFIDHKNITAVVVVVELVVKFIVA
jgi:hypothetical protein